jgi:hypothetical protein
VYCQEHIALTARDPRFVIPDAIKAAERDMMQPADQLIDWCLPELTDTFGYLLPGTVTYLCAFPKNGKTAFLSNNLHYWDRCGVRVWVMPTESRPKGLITRLAAFRVGVPAEEALSRRLRVRMESGDPHAFEQMTSLMSEFSRMAHETRTDGSNIAIEPSPRLTRSVFRKSVAAASAGGYGLVVVDHVDHIGFRRLEHVEAHGGSAVEVAPHGQFRTDQLDAGHIGEAQRRPDAQVADFQQRRFAHWSQCLRSAQCHDLTPQPAIGSLKFTRGSKSCDSEFAFLASRK